jgi:MFS family permease
LPPALLLFAVSFIIVGSGKSIGTILAGAVIAAIGFGSFQPALNSMCILSETPLKRGVATNTLFIGIDLGLFVGPIVGGIVYESYNYSIMFRSTSLIIVIAVLIFVISLPAYYSRRSVLEALET